MKRFIPPAILTLVLLHGLPLAPNVLGDDVDQVAHDNAAWKALRQQIDAIDESERYAVGVELLRASLPDYQTVPFKQRTLYSIGKLYSANGEIDSAIEFLTQAVTLDHSAEDARLAAYFCSELLGKKGDAKAAFAILELVKPKADSGESQPSRTSDYFVSIREAELLQDEEKVVESFQLLRELLDRFPQYSAEILNVATERAGHLFIAEEYRQALGHIESVEELFPEYAALAEVASLKVVYGREVNREIGMELAEQFVDRFPEHPHTVSYLMYLAGVAVDQGKADEATELLTMALNHSKATSDHKAIIETNIGNIKGRKKLNPVVESPSGNRVYLIAVNILALILIVAFILYRRSKSVDRE